MNKVFVTESDLTIKRAAKIMSDNNIGSLVFMKNKRISGIITERDILKNVSRFSLDKKISSIMTKSIVSVEPETTLEEASSVMAENKIKRLLIINKGKLQGIITATDIIANSDLLNEELFS